MNIDLSEKQKLAFYSPATEILYGGAAGGGKSLLLRLSAVRWFNEVPGIQIYFFRRTFPQLRDNHLRGPTSFFALLEEGHRTGIIKYSKQDNEFVNTVNNSRIRLCHCQYELNVEDYQGAEVHVLIMDELTHFTEYQYRFLRSRVRLAGLTIPEKYAKVLPRIECGSNPGSIGHAFVKRTFNPNIPEYTNKIWQASKKEGGLLRQYIPAKLKDNAALLAQDPGYEDRLEGLGNPSLVQAMKDGNWDIFAGQFFEKWDREIHVLPKDFKIEPWWERFGGYDHGHTHPFVWGSYAIDGDGNIIKFAEAGERGHEPDQINDDIRTSYRDAFGLRDTEDKKIITKLDQEINQLKNWAGHDIWSKNHLIMKYGGREIVEQFRQFGLKMLQANTDRINGASWLRSMLDWKRDPSGSIIKRPKFFVRENCWRTINCIPAMQIDENNPEDVKKVDATDEDAWCGDDAYDETRYALMSRWRKSPEPHKPSEWTASEWFAEQMRRDDETWEY